MKIVNRRGFIKSAAVSAAAAASTISIAEASLSKREQIAHHADELMRLLTETAPEGTSHIHHALVSPDGVICSAFEDVKGRKWQNGDRMAEFSLHKGWKEVA